jgi:FG-GAP-like repeat
MRTLRFACLFVISFSTMMLAQSNPIPLLNQPLVPEKVAPGSGKFTLTINGTGFVSGAVVKWNGSSRVTTVVSGSEVKATINPSDVAKVKTASVTVVNPGSGASNVVYFPVRKSAATVTMGRNDKDGEFPYGVVVADMNNDGKLDLVAGNKTTRTTGAIQILLGNGNGSFKAPIDSKSKPAYGPRYAADFNNDGKLDLITLANDSISAFLGNERGAVVQQASSDYCCNDAYVSVADFNGDGNLDLSFVSTFHGEGSYVQIYLGKGNGTFEVGWEWQPSYVVWGQPAIGDFNSDGKLDLAIPDDDGYVDILLGNGDGTFQPPVAYKATYGSGAYVITADVNGDGKLDLITSAGSVLLGNGDGTFTADGGVSTKFSAYGLFAGDFNGDGILDVVGLSSTGNVDIFLGNGDGTFQSALEFAGGTPQGHAQLPLLGIGDFNGDGKLDVVTSGTVEGQEVLSVFLQK